MKKQTFAAALMFLALGLATDARSQTANPCDGKAMHGTTGSGTMFEVNDPVGRNTVTFTSTAPLEDIVGSSNQISGSLWFDPQHPEGGSGYLSVPVASLNTGIPLRDEHLAGEDWLDAGNHPEIRFEIVEVRDLKEVKISGEAQTYDVTVVGDFSLKGVVKRLEVPGRITYLVESPATQARQPGDLLAARAEFEIALADFGITGPDGMDIVGSKVGESIQIKLSVVGSTQAHSMAENPDGGKAVRAGH